MENFIIYMAKVSGLLILFYTAYHIFLRKETFFNSNRWFLLAGLITSIILPFVVYTKTVWINAMPQQPMESIDLNQLIAMQQAIMAQQQEADKINWFDVAAGIYFAGVIFLILRFVYKLISLKRILKGQAIINEGNYKLIDTKKVESPFSFFNYIVYNSAILLPHELENILCHEKVHSRQKHSADMILGELTGIAFWFNPFAWFYKKSISQNLEFIADAGAAKQITDRASYQKTLLKITVQHECMAITNHFYQSLIKKRIVMLNKKQSNKRNSWKYAVVLPALAVFMLLFQVEVVAQEKKSEKAVEEVSYEKIKIAVEVTKDSKDDELEKEKNIFKKEFNADVTFSNITRNENSEITAIKVTVKDATQSKVYEVSGTEPIKPFTIQIEKGNNEKNTIAFGNSKDEAVGLAMLSTYNIDDEAIIEIPDAIASADMIAPPAPPVPPSVIAPLRSAGNKIEILNGSNKDALVIINGVQQEKGSAIKISAGQSIASIKILDKKDAKKKYGKEAKQGAVEIITKQQDRFVYRHQAPMIMNLDEMQGGFNVITPDMPGELKVFTDINADVARQIAEQLKSFEDMGELDVIKIRKEMQRGLNQLKRGEMQLQRNQERMERTKEREQMTEERQEKMKQLRTESRVYSRKEIEEARKEMQEAREEMAKVREEMAKVRKELEKELNEMNKENE